MNTLFKILTTKVLKKKKDNSKFFIILNIVKNNTCYELNFSFFPGD